ncbi:MAG: hypothetical protein MUF24_10525 [Chitinophagaceae bacterium]|jgi:hypothetical protein|nr:hypothetical protein [Chitinophagaceae bacterium]
MKLLFITCIREHRSTVAAILSEAKIPVYSISETEGVKAWKDDDLSDDWYGTEAGTVASLIIFSFTSDNNAALALTLINNYNEEKSEGFPIRAFVLKVEQSNL